MKFRILQDENGIYIQKKILGIWWNWFLHARAISFPDKYYYNDVSLEYIEKILSEYSSKCGEKSIPKLVKEINFK